MRHKSPLHILAITATSLAIALAHAQTAPSTTTAPATPTIHILQADQILNQFPINAALRVPRKETLTIEGRVLELRDPKPAAGAKPSLRIVLVGYRQADGDLTHITCAIDPAAEAAARALAPGTIVRLTGIGAGVTVDADRVDLVNSRDITPLPAAPVYGSMLLGRWSGNLLMNAAAFTPWRNWAKFRDAAGAISFQLRLTADQASLEIDDLGGPLAESAGMWKLIQDTGKGPQLFLALKDLDPVYIPITYDGQSLQLGAPAEDESPFTATVTCTKSIGRPLLIDDDAATAQLQAWLKANVSLPDPSKLFDDAMKKLAETQADDGTFCMLYGPALLKTKKATQLCIVRGKLLTFEFTDAQAQKSAIGPAQANFSNVKSRALPLVPEVKIDALVLDNKNTLSLGEDLTGHITLRALRRAPGARYALVMENVHGAAFFYFDQPPGADSETVDFKFGKLDPVYQSPNPLVMIFSVCRINSAGNISPLGLLAGGGGELLSVSAPEVRLLDVTP